MMYQQRTLNFQPPANVEAAHVAEQTSEPPPAHQARQAPPLVRPDRQLPYDGAPHYEWPDPTSLHDRDTITVDRIREDIDGPSHRFIIKRGDRVEAWFGTNNLQEGTVVGISHAGQEVRVRFREGTDGQWFYKGQIYPAIESKGERPKNGDPLSKFIAAVNDKYGKGLVETDRIPRTESGEPKPVVINDRLIIVPVGFKENSTAAATQPAAPELPAYTFDDFKAFHREFRHGSIAFEEYRRQFERLLASREAVKGELLARYKSKELAVLASRFGSWQAKRSSKEENAAHIVSKMLSSFVLDGTVSYRPLNGETYEDAVAKKVLGLTAGEYARVFEKRQAASLEHQKALENPETFAEFRTFIIDKGEDALTDEQLARYDALHADVTRERRASETPATVVKFQSEELQSIQFQLKEGFHDKRQCPLWIVQLATRVEREAFNELNRKAKMLGGWFSSFKKSDAGFQFLNKDNAEKFCSLLEGDADRSEVLEARKERKELTAAERLHELAEELLKRADETIERSNQSLQNTARRADIQAGVRGRAFADQAMSRTLHSIAEALSRGEANYLDGIRHKTHVETLDVVLYRAKWARARAHQQESSESTYEHGRRMDRIEAERIGPQTIRFAEFPYPYVYKRTLLELVALARNRSGLKQVALKMQKRLTGENDDYLTFKTERDIESLADFIDRAKAAGLDVDRTAAALEDYKRLRRANITDIHELRAALREYLRHRGEARGDSPVQIAERELIGKKLPGFFPTPRPVIERMLERAQVQSQHKVLEPSCGKGDILDALIDNCPGIELVAIERNYTLSDVLSAKGHEVQFGDFLEHQGTYDRIVMNPPFEDGQDIEHVQHAYRLLRPGGRLVAVMSTGPFFRSDKKAIAFREWIGDVNASVEWLPDDAFKGQESFRQTGVRTRLLTINKEDHD